MTLRSFFAGPPLVALVLLVLFDPGFSELKNFAPTIIIAFLAIWATLKIAPVRHAEKMRELDVREKEIAQREHSAIALQSMADTVRDIAIEQRHATEALRIAERVTIREGEKLSDTVHEIRETVQAVASRVELIEKAATA